MVGDLATLLDFFLDLFPAEIGQRATHCSQTNIRVVQTEDLKTRILLAIGECVSRYDWSVGGNGIRDTANEFVWEDGVVRVPCQRGERDEPGMTASHAATG